MKTRIFSYLITAILISIYSCKPKSITPVPSKVEYDSISQLIVQFNIESNANSILVCDLTDRVISFQETGLKFNQTKSDFQLGPKILCMKMNSREITYLCDSILRDFKTADFCSNSISESHDNANGGWSDDVIMVADSDRYSNEVLVVFKDGHYREFRLFCSGTKNQIRLIKYLVSIIRNANSDSQSEQYLTDLSSKYK